MTDARERLESINARLAGLFKAERQTLTALKGLTDVAMREGAISPQIKELAAMAIAVAKGCDDCIVYHTAAAIRPASRLGSRTSARRASATDIGAST